MTETSDSRIKSLADRQNTMLQQFDARSSDFRDIAEGLHSREDGLAIVNGRTRGKVLYLQAASDGDELNGIEVIRRILKQVKPAKLVGAVIAAPVVNLHGFHAHQGHSPADGLKMNRCFPGWLTRESP